MLAAALKRKEEEWKRIYLEEGKREGKQEGKREGRLEGKQEGARLTALANAKALKERGVDITTIAEATGLTLGEVEGL